MHLPSHGANPLRLYESLGMKVPEKIIDFSENVNPVGPPASVRENWSHYFKLLSAYPDPTGEPFLSKVAAFHKVETNKIVLGNGASELFAVLARRYTGKRVIVVHPTFSEYEATLEAAKAEIVSVVVDDIGSWQLPIACLKQEMIDASALYLCTPNNPTGVLPSRTVLDELIAYGGTVDCEIILDEAFIDWVDEKLSFIPLIQENPHVIVVRSMTKLYAIPGIRLGYLVADEVICQNLKQQMPHWHINGLAAVIGAECLDSWEYAQEAVRIARLGREKIRKILDGYGCLVSDSVTNYMAFHLPKGHDAHTFFMFCLARGVVLRHSQNFKGMNGQWFRIGVKEDTAIAFLHVVLAEWFEKEGRK